MYLNASIYRPYEYTFSHPVSHSELLSLRFQNLHNKNKEYRKFGLILIVSAQESLKTIPEKLAEKNTCIPKTFKEFEKKDTQKNGRGFGLWMNV